MYLVAGNLKLTVLGREEYKEMDGVEQDNRTPVNDFAINELMLSLGFKWGDNTNSWITKANYFEQREVEESLRRFLEAHTKPLNKTNRKG